MKQAAKVRFFLKRKGDDGFSSQQWRGKFQREGLFYKK